MADRLVLSDEDLTAMRYEVSQTLPDTAVIQESSWVSNGGGGGTTTWTAAGTVDCRVKPVASSGEGEVLQGGRVHPDTEYVFSFPYGTEIAGDQQVVFEGGTFTVTAPRTPRSFELVRTVEFKEVK